MPALGRWFVFGVALAALGAPTPADAQRMHPIENARRLIDRAQFDDAIQLLDRLEEAEGGLTREELVRLYATRAGAHLAVGHTGEMERDLARLAALEPGYRFPAEARPELQEGLTARARERIALELHAEHDRSGARVHARVRNDPGGLARHVRVRARAVGSEAWIDRTDAEAVVPTPGADVEYWGELIGPGGAIIASLGSAASPLLAAVPPGLVPEPEPEPEPQPGPGPADGGDDLPLVLGIGGGVLAAVLAIAVVVGVAANQGPSSETQPTPPMILSFPF